MNTPRSIYLLITLAFLMGCATTSPSGTSSTSAPNARVDATATSGSDANTLSKGCPLDKMQWLYKSANYDVGQQNELASRLAEAAQSDATTLDRMVANRNNNPMVISSALKAFVEKAAQTRTPVSDDFYKQYVKNRMTMCAVMDALRSGSIKADESSKVAGNTFREIAKTFESFKTN